MKKVMLITAMFMATNVWSMYPLESNSEMKVFCISSYVVVVSKSGGAFQLMKTSGGKPTPMRCNDYD